MPVAGVHSNGPKPYQPDCLALLRDGAKAERPPMRILIVCGASRQREGGVAGVVYNLASELRSFGHTVDCLFREDLLARRKLPERLDTVDLAIQAAGKIRRARENYDVVNIHAPFGFAYGFLRKWRGGALLPPYVMMMYGLEEQGVRSS